MFVFAMLIWALIEGIGLVTEMRVYNPPEDRIPVFIFVALVEDPGLGLSWLYDVGADV